MDQLQMFGLPPEKQGPVGPAEVPPELAQLAARLRPNLRLGTSSWSFPGWEGLVYDRRVSDARLAKEGLAAYARHPLLRTVGVDRAFYAPVPVETYQAYAAAVPADFRFLVKVLSEVVSPLRAPERGGGDNPRFLDPELCKRAVIEPFAALGDKAGPLLFQFPPFDVRLLGGAWAFAERLHAFLWALPKGLLYAVELRCPDALSFDYAAALADLGAVHCLNVHPTMPAPSEQAARLAEAYREAPAVVVRWMLHAGLRYEAAKERYEPFDRLVDPDPESRADLGRLLSREGRPTYVVINNKAEGSSPLSAIELARALTS